MGLFGTKETINSDHPGEVTADSKVASSLPDPGDYFLGQIAGLLDEGTYHRLQNEINARRSPSKALVAANFSDVPSIGRKQTPLSILRPLLAGQSAMRLGVWGTLTAPRGRQSRTLENTLVELTGTQGHAAAATWAIAARPETSLHLSDLAQAMNESWEQDLSWVSNGDLTKAFKNWR